MIYFDNAATTKPSESVIKAVNDSLCEFGNPSSLHKLGLAASQRVAVSRKIIAASLGALSEEIFFTSGATESDNTAIFGAANSLGKRKKRIVVSSVEHPAVSEPCRQLEAKGFEVIRVSPRDGVFYPEDFIEAVNDNTCIISMMFFNNETGARLPVAETFRRLKKKYPDLLTHCDHVQGFMKERIKVKTLFADLISVSGHKLHAPKGIGALYIKKGIHIPSFIYGGGQESGFRSGTESVPLISAFGASIEELSNNMDSRVGIVTELSEYLREKLSQIEGVYINSPVDATPFIVSFAVKGYRSEILLHYLEQREIYVSSGSACSKGKKSSVLSEFGIPDDLADSTLRVSFSSENTLSEIDELISALVDAKQELVSK